MDDETAEIELVCLRLFIPAIDSKKWPFNTARAKSQQNASDLKENDLYAFQHNRKLQAVALT